MTFWHLLIFVIVLGGLVAWKGRERAAWIERALAWMFLGSFVSSVGIATALDFQGLNTGGGMVDLTSRAILGFGFVWVAWLIGEFVPVLYRTIRSRLYALRARPSLQNPG